MTTRDYIGRAQAHDSPDRKGSLPTERTVTPYTLSMPVGVPLATCALPLLATCYLACFFLL